jgi:hypothetical protein
MAAGYSNLNIELVDGLVDTLAKYLYSMAGIVEGDVIRCNTYLDAADCLMDVIAMWKEDEEAA